MLSLTTVFALTGLVGWRQKGFPQRFPGAPHQFSADSPLTNIARKDNGWCFYSIDTDRTLTSGQRGVECSIGDRGSPRRNGLLFGDSFAGSYEPFWDVIGRADHLSLTSATTNWCYPSFGRGVFAPRSSRAYGQCLYDRDYVKRNVRNFDFVVLGGMWSEILKRGKMGDVLDLIETLSRNGRLTIIMPSPKQYDYSPFLDYERHYMFNRPFSIAAVGAQDDTFAKEANALLKAASQKRAHVIFLDRDALTGGTEVSEAGIPYSADGVHVSIYGAQELAKQFIRTRAYAALVKEIDGQRGSP